MKNVYKKKRKKKETKSVISIFISFILYHFRTFNVVFLSVKCQNSASDLIKCYCTKCVFLSAYECLQKHICIHIMTYIS